MCSRQSETMGAPSRWPIEILKDAPPPSAGGLVARPPPGLARASAIGDCMPEAGSGRGGRVPGVKRSADLWKVSEM